VTHKFHNGQPSHGGDRKLSTFPAAPAYGVYISQLIRYSRACGFHQDFLDKGLLLTRKLLNQGFLLVKLKSSLRKFYATVVVNKTTIRPRQSYQDQRMLVVKWLLAKIMLVKKHYSKAEKSINDTCNKFNIN